MKREKKPKGKRKRIIVWAVVAALLAGMAFVGIDFYTQFSIKSIPDLPQSDVNGELIYSLLLYLEKPELQKRDGVTIDDEYVVNAVTPIKVYIDGRYDCSDFRMQAALRLMYSHGDELRAISPDGVRLIEEMFLNAKYWMTEPGEDSMCYWSENHQLLFAVAEYMAGQYWPDKVFTNDGATGRQHMERGRERIGYWMRQRFEDGYSEFNSSVYYRYDVGPAANFIQFAAKEDCDMVERMKMCLDLLFFDIALYTYNHELVTPMGRAYAYSMSGNDSLRGVTDLLWELDPKADDNTGSQEVNVAAMLRARDAAGKPYYELPPVLREIMKDDSERTLRASYSLNFPELRENGYIGHEDAQIMRQLSMEAMTNPEVIYNTITYLDKNDLLSNKFLNDFKLINLKILRNPKTLEWISKTFNPMPNGVAIQRANLYSYQTPLYAMASVQRYHPGSYGASQYLNALNFGERAVVFTTHPARFESVGNATAVPGYWAGYGRAPHSVQEKNVLLLLYELPKKSGFLELYDVPQFTHTYLPELYFDEVRVDGRYAFARSGGAFLGLTAAGELTYADWSEASAIALRGGLIENPDKRFDLIQNSGLKQYWVYEVSDTSKESFDVFVARIKANKTEYDGKTLVYESDGQRYETAFGGDDFKVNSETRMLEYKRFDNPYCVAERGAEEFIIEYAGYYLRIHFGKAEREY